VIKIREKYKIISYDLSNLQLASCGIKINSEVPEVFQKNNLLSTAKILTTELTDFEV